MVRQEILRRRRAFLTAMAELLRRRRAIQGSLPAADNVPEGSIDGLSTDYLRPADAVERMHQNLEKDHSIVRRFTGGIVHQVPLTTHKMPRCLCRYLSQMHNLFQPIPILVYLACASRIILCRAHLCPQAGSICDAPLLDY